ncbi:MAG: penicillin-binding protein activator [Deltaproteobacteria bacterium]|nr:penicillin-binding protein activator [Deltaproteobacteria bacterium]
MSRPSTARFLRPVLLLALLGTAACPSRTAQPRPSAGEPVVQPGAGNATLAGAERARAEGRLQDALALFEAFARDHPRAPQAPGALLAAGQIAHQLEQRDTARRALETLALNHPGDPAAKDAKLLLASMDLEDGRTAEGVSGLRSALEQMQGPEKLAYSQKMGRALYESGQFAGAVVPLSTAEAGTTDAAVRDPLRAMLQEIIDGRLRFAEVLALREQLPATSWTHHLLTLKLGRIYLHLGDDVRAMEELKAYVAAEPQGAFLTSAQAALQILDIRTTVVANRLGVVLPTSGKYAQTGERLLAALKLGLEAAVSDAIARGQTNPPPAPVEVEVLDDTSGPEDAAAALDLLITEKRVMAVVGAVTLQGARPAAMRAEAAKVPLLTLSRRDGIAEMGPFTFQVALSDERQAREMARIASETLGFKRVAFLYPRLPKGAALMNAFWDEFESRGGSVAGVEAYDHDETTFAVPVRKLVGRHFLEARGDFLACQAEARKLEAAYKKQKALEACKDGVRPIVDFEALFIADYHKPAGLIAPALAFEDVFVGNDERSLRQFKETTGAVKVQKVTLLGTNGFNDKTFPQRGGKYVQGALFVDGFNPNDGRPETLDFLKKFAAATGGLKGELRDAQAFDAGRMLGAVFVQNPKTRTEFRDKLQAIKDFPGICGPTSVDAQGNAVAPLQVFTVKGESIIPAHLEPRTGG